MELKGICNQGHLKKGINRAEEGNLHLLNDDHDRAIFMFFFFLNPPNSHLWFV